MSENLVLDLSMQFALYNEIRPTSFSIEMTFGLEMFTT